MNKQEINCQDCRHEEDKTRPRNTCLACKNKSNFEPKETKPRHSETLDNALFNEENL